MPKKRGTKRTQVKDLPRKDKKLSAGDMKKVKGGAYQSYTEIKVAKVAKSGDGSVKPQGIIGHELGHG